MPKALYPVLACSFLCLCDFLFHGSSWTSYPRFVLSKEILRLSLRTSSTKEKTLSFSGMKTVTSSDWIPAVAGIQLYREVFEVSEFIVTLIAVSKTSRYNPFALRCSSITRSDRAKRILYFQFLLSYLMLSLLFVLFSFVSRLSTANCRLLLPTVYDLNLLSLNLR